MDTSHALSLRDFPGTSLKTENQVLTGFRQQRIKPSVMITGVVRGVWFEGCGEKGCSERDMVRGV